MSQFFDEHYIDELAVFGDGVLAYVKPISIDDAKDLVGEMGRIPDDIELFCLFSADGTPLAISDSKQSALDNAFEQDLEAVHLH